MNLLELVVDIFLSKTKEINAISKHIVSILSSVTV